MKGTLRLILACGLLFLSACAGAPFPATELTRLPARSAAEITRGLWNYGSGTLLIRQSALFELRGMRLPLEGMLRLDLATGKARLVGMNDLGVKLYDISVDREGSRANFLLPEFRAYPGFAEAVALSVRRIFLEPLPAPGDHLELSGTEYRFTRKGERETLGFLVGGNEAQLLEKSCRGEGCSWRVRYYQYRREQGIPFPGGIVLEERRAGYRLTLWIESVEKSDE